MDVIYGLIPSMIFIGLVLVGLLFWSIRSGQFDDFEGEGHRILMDEDVELKKTNKEKKVSETITETEGK
ncbi:MAG: cbb3-type cytochrome oxidase assembly protein CcoS [Gammaproteobacteria bacterium]|nr:cbb3-type cytochrome oxidase assembly protein CcoS [Gammaproteobacteria bacterium]